MGKVNILSSLFLCMPFIINIHGPIASGKTTTTKLLQKKFKNILYIDKPALKKDLKLLGKEKARKISSEASYFMLGQCINTKKNILVSEMSPTKIVKHFKTQMNKYNYTLFSFFLDCSLPTSMKRVKIRSDIPSLDYLGKNYKKFSKPEKGDIVIDTEKLTPKESLQFILQHVGSDHKNMLK